VSYVEPHSDAGGMSRGRKIALGIGLVYLVGLIGFAVACLRPNRGLGMAMAETYGVLAAIFVVVLALGLVLPGAG